MNNLNAAVQAALRSALNRPSNPASSSANHPHHHPHHHPHLHPHHHPHHHLPNSSFNHQYPFQNAPYPAGIPYPPPACTPDGYTFSETMHHAPPYSQFHHPSPPPRRPRPHSFNRCLPCKITFPSIPQLVYHQTIEHQKCSEPGCLFEALPDIVEIHEEDRHLRFKPGKEPQAKPKSLDGPADATIQGLGYRLQSEEQIRRWVEERRKNWPTAKVILEKNQKKAQNIRSRSARDDLLDQSQAKNSKRPKFDEAAKKSKKIFIPQPTDLLSKLLARDIDQHVYTLLEVVDFLVDNNFLDGVETEIDDSGPIIQTIEEKL